MGALTWLHLSDLQFSTSRTYDTNVVLRTLLHDVAKCVKWYGLYPDFIAVTGDIAFSGKAIEYDLARQFFDDLLQTTGLDKDRLFLVPGNHDVDRAQVSPGARNIAKALTDRASANAVLASSGDRQLLFTRFAGYAAFVNDYLGKHLLFDPDHYFYTRTVDLAGRRVAVLGLNSAWLSVSDQDEAQGLVVGERQVRAALEEAGRADLKIALLHHPFDRLREFDQDDVKAMLCYGCDFVLHGHVHRTNVLRLRGPNAEAMIIAAGTRRTIHRYPNSYNTVQINLAGGSGTVYLRRYSDERGDFWTRDTISYRNASTGRYNFQLTIRKPKTLGPEEEIHRGLYRISAVVLAEEPAEGGGNGPGYAGDTARVLDHRISWPPGYILDDKYEIVTKVATTGYCEIYQANELRYTRRMVAVKRLKPDVVLEQDGLDLREVHERFEREIAILRHMDHPFVLRLLDEGGKIEDGDRYFVTQFADKGSLSDYLETKPGKKLDLAEALAIARAMCQAIDGIHRLDIIHRDIKPGNIFLFSGPEGYTVKLADFSIAKVPKRWSIRDTITQVDVFLGTYPYSAPEQFESELGNPRSDLYAWAAVVFEMLAGEPLGQSLTGESREVSFLGLLRYYRTSRDDELPASLFADRGVPAELVVILQKALRKDPERRYRTAEELQNDLVRAQALLTDPGARLEERYRLGVERWKNGDLQGAIEQLEGIFQGDEPFVKAQSALGGIYDQLGNRSFKGLRFITAIRYWLESDRLYRKVKRAH